MNQEWAEKNRQMQSLLKKATLEQGILELLELREMMMQEVLTWREVLSPEDYCAMPFPDAAGYHSKTVAYSLWHIARIEDIVVNSLVRKRAEVFTDYAQRLHSPIITTGNELKGDQIAAFSGQLDLDALYDYFFALKADTDTWLKTLDYTALKQKFTDSDRAALEALNVVSTDESAHWLVDYWCGKDLKGLIQMPMSRHWIMHIEACLRIIQRLKKGKK